MLEDIKKLLREAAFWDIFGIIVFGFIVFKTVESLSTNTPFSRPIITILFIIGVAGFIIDSGNVWQRWGKNDKKDG